MMRFTDKPEVIVLQGSEPIASGTNREVWDRPGHPEQILKTVRLHKREKYDKRSKFQKKIADLRHGPFGVFRSEYRCYLTTAYRCYRLEQNNPIAEIGGLVITDHGLAQVSEKITSSDGALAVRLSHLIKDNRLDVALLNALNRFVETLYRVNVNVPDMTSSNILWDEKRNRFVLVDGFGDRTLIPVLAWIPPLNRRQISMSFARMAESGYLKWDSTTKQFSFA